MISASELVKNTITELRKFNHEVTKNEILNHLLGSHPNPELVEVKGKLYKERGCFGGPCACTGACQELIEASALDVIYVRQHIELQHLFKPFIEQHYGE